MASTALLQERVWTDRTKYYEAECAFYQNASKARLTPLADEVAKARQRLIEVIDASKEPHCEIAAVDTGAVKFLERKVIEVTNLLNAMQQQFSKLESRLLELENKVVGAAPVSTKGLMVCPKKPSEPTPMDDDDDVDLFGSDSEGDETADKVREERLAAYNEKKSKKVAIIAKSSVVLDIKPWEDSTDMKLMEENVRAISMDGLLWGAAKLVPLAYGIKKLQISAVVEDDKVSIDELQEKIEGIEELVQSMDIAAFNKI